MAEGSGSGRLTVEELERQVAEGAPIVASPVERLEQVMREFYRDTEIVDAPTDFIEVTQDEYERLSEEGAE